MGIEKFKELGISEPILKVIVEKGFEEPTEVQVKSIPLIMQGKDVIAESATGSGKTLAFGTGIIRFSDRGRGITSLVLTPTRELAEQVKKEVESYSKYDRMKFAVVYGGVGMEGQVNAIRHSDAVVGTPGRILDHMRRGTLDFSGVKVLVIDEADRMLDMGFIDDVEQIVSACPKERMTLLFSATIMPEVAQLAHRYMNEPVQVSAAQYVDPSLLKQVYYDVPDNMKFSLLVHLLKNESSNLVMVFCNSRHNVDFVADNLRRNELDATPIHGGLSQARRTRTMDEFHSQSVKVLVCTDIAARGLDIKGVSHVYNYDIPRDSRQYIHRIGRTARAGAEGNAISILASRDYDNFTRVLRENDVHIEPLPLPSIERAQMVVESRGSRGGFGGGFRGGPRQGGARGHWGNRSSRGDGERPSHGRGGGHHSQGGKAWR